MMMWMAILYFYTICEYAILTEVDIAESSSSSRGQKRGRDSNEGKTMGTPHQHQLSLGELEYKLQ